MSTEVRLEGVLSPDASVRGVERLHSPKGIEKFLREVSRVLPLDGRITLAAVKQRPGQRALLRITLTPETSAGPARAWYVKLDRRKGNDRFSMLCELSDHAARLGVRIPRPRARIPRYRATIFEGLPGRSLLECAADSPSGALRIFEETGRTLALLHAGLPVPVATSGPEEEIRRLAGLRPRIASIRPDLLGRFDESARAWTIAHATRLARTFVTLHGDFYPSQVLYDAGGSAGPRVESGGLSILDWDEICAGDAERDAGNFIAHLLLEVARGRLPVERTREWARAFQAGYGSLRPLDPVSLFWYYEGSVLRLAALHAEPRFGQYPPNPPELSERLLAPTLPDLCSRPVGAPVGDTE